MIIKILRPIQTSLSGTLTKATVPCKNPNDRS